MNRTDKAIALSELILNTYITISKRSVRNSRLNKAFKKRAYIKSKFYNKLAIEKQSICLIPMLAYNQFMTIQSQPTPKFEKGTEWQPCSEYKKNDKFTMGKSTFIVK